MNRQQRRAAERRQVKAAEAAAPDERTFVCWLSGADPTFEFMVSMMGLYHADFDRPEERRRLLTEGGGYMGYQSSPRIGASRCELVRQFLTRPEFTTTPWLLMVDDDMAFGPDLLDRLHAAAHPVRAPIVGGLCFTGRNDDLLPTIYQVKRLSNETVGDVELMRMTDFPEDRLIEVGATGAACLLIHRSVLEAMARPFPAGFGTKADAVTPNPYPWFQEGIITPAGRELGEDIIFCLRAGALGVPIHVHTGIDVGHKKTQILNLASWRKYRGVELPEEYSWHSGSPSATSSSELSTS